MQTIKNYFNQILRLIMIMKILQFKLINIAHNTHYPSKYNLKVFQEIFKMREQKALFSKSNLEIKILMHFVQLLNKTLLIQTELSLIKNKRIKINCFLPLLIAVLS